MPIRSLPILLVPTLAGCPSEPDASESTDTTGDGSGSGSTASTTSTTSTTAVDETSDASSTTAGADDPCVVGTLVYCFDTTPTLCACEEDLGDFGDEPRVHVADFDGDGDHDVVVVGTKRGVPEVNTLTNDGAGLVAGTPQSHDQPARSMLVESTAAVYLVSSTEVVPYDFAGGLLPPVPLSLTAVDPWLEDVTIGDFDGDGTVDLVRKRYLPDPMGTLAPGFDFIYDVLAPSAVSESHELIPSRFSEDPRIHACDVDGDGASELFDQIDARVLLDPAPGMPLEWSPAPWIYGQLWCYDLDADGAVDVITRLITDTSNDQAVAYNDGNEVFGRPEPLPHPPYGLDDLFMDATLPARLSGDLPVVYAIGEKGVFNQNSALGFARQTAPRVFEEEYGTELTDVLLRAEAAIDLEGDGRDELLVWHRDPSDPEDVSSLRLLRIIDVP